jgi:hypothetical protein
MAVQHISNYTKVSQKVSLEIPSDFGWSVAGSYAIEKARLADDVVVSIVNPDYTAEGMTYCRPGLRPHLLREFASCSDEHGLLEFIRQNGLLGFRRLYPSWPEGTSWKGDPVTWALAHSDVVAGVLQLVEYFEQIRTGRVVLNEDNSKSTAECFARVFRTMGLKGPNEDSQPGSVTFTFVRPEHLGDEERRSTKWIYAWEDDPVGGCHALLVWLINPMIAGIHYGYREPEPKEWLDSSAKLNFELTFGSLLEVIYWRLAAYLGRGFSRCTGCGHVFPAQGRQLYCSFRCGNRSKCKRYREKNRSARRKSRRSTRRAKAQKKKKTKS